MNELKTLEQKIENILMRSLSSRSDDWLLTWNVYHYFYGIGYGASFAEVMNRHRELGLPTPESIARIRRKVQERNPKKYAPTEDVAEFRRQRDIEFYDYAKEIRLCKRLPKEPTA